MEYRVGDAEINAQSQGRKRCVEQDMRLEKHCHCCMCIGYCHVPDPPNHCVEDRAIDIEEINEATGNEEEEGEM